MQHLLYEVGHTELQRFGQFTNLKMRTFCMFSINSFSKNITFQFVLYDKDYGFKLLLNLIMQLNNAFLITLRINLISTINYLNSTKTTLRRCIECMWFTWLTWHDIPYLWHIWSFNKNTNIITEGAKPKLGWFIRSTYWCSMNPFNHILNNHWSESRSMKISLKC